jgi:predicted transcriptional regulator
MMKTVKIIVRKASDDDLLAEAAQGFINAWNDGGSQDDVLTFTSPAQLFSVLTPKRWELIEKLQAMGPSTYRALSAALGRDVKRVHDDTVTLREWGLVSINTQGRIFVPYDIIHADFNLQSAA